MGIWADLKSLEEAVLLDRVHATLDRGRVDRLRRLLAKCRETEDAEEAICFHGAWSLVHEFDCRFGDALRHRAIEIELIGRLHETTFENPSTASFALQGYEASDLELRRAILADLEVAADAGAES